VLTLPPNIADVSKHHRGQSDTFILHIQDAHANEEAQRNIENILKHFVDQAGLKTIYVEGAEGQLFPEFFSFFPNKKAREMVGDYFLKHAKLKGPEHYALVERPEVDFVGAENSDLYEKNRQAYLNALKLKERDDQALKDLEIALNKISRFALSPQIRDLIRYRQNYASEGQDLIGYIQYLVKTANKQGLDTSSYKSINQLLDLVSLEASIDFKNAKIVLAEFLDYLKNHLEEKEQKEFQRITLQFQMQRISAKDYYAFLESYLKEMDSEQFQNTKLIESYFRYRMLYDSLDVSLFEQISNIEKAIEDELLISEEEKKIGYLYRVLDIYIKLFNFSLTQTDAEFYYRNSEDFKSKTFTEFLKPLYKRYRFDSSLPDVSALDQDLKNVDMFYQYAMERDEVLIKNAFSAIEHEGQKIIALITGGFHTPGIEKHIEEQGYSYAIVSPSIRKKMDLAEEAKLYEDSITQKPLELENRLMQIVARPQQSGLNDPRFQLASASPFPSLKSRDAFVQKISSLHWGAEDIDPDMTPAVPMMMLLNVLSSMLSEDENENRAAIQAAVKETLGESEQQAVLQFLNHNQGVKRTKGKQIFYWIKNENNYGAFGLAPESLINEVDRIPGFQNSQVSLEADFANDLVLFYRQIDADMVPADVVKELDAQSTALDRDVDTELARTRLNQTQLTALNQKLAETLSTLSGSPTDVGDQLSVLLDANGAALEKLALRSELRSEEGEDPFELLKTLVSAAQEGMANELDVLQAQIDIDIKINDAMQSIAEIQIEWGDDYEDVMLILDALKDSSVLSSEQDAKKARVGLEAAKEKFDAAWDKFLKSIEGLSLVHGEKLLKMEVVKESLNNLYDVVGPQSQDLQTDMRQLREKVSAVQTEEESAVPVVDQAYELRNQVFQDLTSVEEIAEPEPQVEDVAVERSEAEEAVAQVSQLQEKVSAEVSSKWPFFTSVLFGLILTLTTAFFYSTTDEERAAIKEDPVGATKQFFGESIPSFFKSTFGKQEADNDLISPVDEQIFLPLEEDIAEEEATIEPEVKEKNVEEALEAEAEEAVVKVIPVPTSSGLDSEMREKLWGANDPLDLVNAGVGFSTLIQTLEDEQLLNLSLYFDREASVGEEAQNFESLGLKHTNISELSPYERTDFYALLNLAAIDQKDLRYLTEPQRKILLDLLGRSSLNEMKYEDLPGDVKVKLQTQLMANSPLMNLAKALQISLENPEEFYLLDLYAKFLKPIFVRYDVERSEMNMFVTYLSTHMDWIDSNFPELKTENSCFWIANPIVM
jgi:hypothetical protein